MAPTRGCAYLPLSLLGAYQLVPPKCGKVPYLPAAPTQGGAISRSPQLVPNQQRTKYGEAPCLAGEANSAQRPLPSPLTS